MPYNQIIEAQAPFSTTPTKKPAGLLPWDRSAMKRLHIPVLFLSFSVAAGAPMAAQFKSPSHAELPQTIEFNRDIRPILSDNCFLCHGPDKAQRKGNLRLDIEKDAQADRGGYHILVPGNLEKSALWHRITTTEKREHMPPLRTGKKLTDRQIALLRRWIEQGAQWQAHWSLIPPRRPPLPQVQHRSWPRNPIDHFVLARLEREGLSPAPEADRRTLIRRVSLDLTGLPPTIKEVDAFLADQSPDAYEKVVDRLLASPRFGEHMALPWLDAARYADTNGYQGDGERSMWRWRDWVIEAFNHNMPFDQFTIEQLAGDLLPHPTLDQKIATGFNRNHRGNAEGGIIPEEYLVEYAADRVDTTATVWLGLTVACARCHDHKYDPITQKEFYQLFAYFNNIPERGKVIRFGNSPPWMKAPTREQQEQMRQLQTQIAAAEKVCQDLEPELQAGQRRWEKSIVQAPPRDWTLTEGLLARYTLNGDLRNAFGTTKPAQVRAGSAQFEPGPLGPAAIFDGKRYIDAGNVGGFSFYDKFSFAAWVNPANAQAGTILSRMQDMDRAEGYSLLVTDGAIQLNLVKRWLDDSLRLETNTKLKPGRWYHVVVTYDGSRSAKGVTIYIDAERQPLHVNLDDLNQDFRTDAPLKIGAGGDPGQRWHGALADVRLYDRCLSADEAGLVATTDSITSIAKIASAKQSRSQAYKLRSYFLTHDAPEHLRQAHRKVRELQSQLSKLDEAIPTVMIMEERPTPRETHLLLRGVYDRPGVQVQRNIPASLPALAPGAPRDRLGLARWLVSPTHPLTARVTVNRFWQMYFGMGLVRTAEDFGSQGEWPSHPELLDWLSTEFIRTGWNVKALQRLIVTSATYRQASRVTPELVKRDPDNRLLARGPRVRLSAQTIRDQALFISGLFVPKIGGPSVKPYQPPGLWNDLADIPYVPDKGENLYRRSLYTFWKRTIAPPALATFDAAGRESCIVRQTRTNTPLQALNLLNDVTYVEAARVLAERMMQHGGRTPAERIDFAFRLATARRPQFQELQILTAGFETHLARYRREPKAALKAVSIGEWPRSDKMDIAELAAYAAVAGVIFNLDETITKQ
jgi:hypothetical protein